MNVKKGFFMIGNICLLLMLVFVTFGCAKPGEVSPADFFKSKTLDWSAGSPTGGNIDAVGRILQTTLQKELGTSVVMTYRTAGNGLETYNHIYAAEPDGTVLTFHTTSILLLSAIFSPDTVKYEPEKFSYLVGFPAGDPMMFFVTKDSPYSTIDALKAGKNLKLGTTAPGSSYSLSTTAVASLLNLDAKVLSGIQGAAGIVLMMTQKELAGAAMASTQGPPFADKIKPLFVLGTKRAPLYPDIPALSELVKFTDPAQKQLLEMGDTLLAINRVVFTSPNVPKDRVEFLRNLFLKKIVPGTLTDMEKALGGGKLNLNEFVAGQNVAKEMIEPPMKNKAAVKSTFDSIVAKYRM